MDIISGFLLMKEKKLEIDMEAMENARKKMERGLELFSKHYLNLWD